MSKFKFALLAMCLAIFTVQPAIANVLSNDDMEFAFQHSNITTFSDYSEIALLSDQEMISTEGEWLPIVIRFGPMAAKLAYHGAHHTFRWIGRSPHLQLNWWKPGVSGSEGAFRIPWQWWKHY